MREANDTPYLRFIGCFLASLSVVGLACSSKVSASDANTPKRTFFHVRVFECYVPIPSDYVLNTNERGHFLFLQRPESGPGVIDISAKDPHWEPSETVQVVQQTKEKSLNVTRYEIGPQHLGGERGPTRSVVVVDDGSMFVSIVGDDAEIAKTMINGCVQSMEQ
jgi:hypothetical protein